MLSFVKYFLFVNFLKVFNIKFAVVGFVNHLNLKTLTWYSFLNLFAVVGFVNHINFKFLTWYSFLNLFQLFKYL